MSSSNTSRKTVALTEDQRRVVLSALLDKQVETEQYLSSYRQIGEEPGALDSCCPAHLDRYAHRRAERTALEARLRTVTEAIALFNA